MIQHWLKGFLTLGELSIMDKISHLYVEYDDIVKEIGRKKVRERFNDLYVEYDEFIKQQAECDILRINDYTLMHSVLDYFTDVSRLKHFHSIGYTNLYKTKAYEISWLLRRKPIQIISDNDCDSVVYINEKFVLSHIMSYFVSLVGKDFYSDLSEEGVRAFDGYIDSLYYHLKYRNCSSQTLEIILLSFGAGIVATGNKLNDMFDNE